MVWYEKKVAGGVVTDTEWNEHVQHHYKVDKKPDKFKITVLPNDWNIVGRPTVVVPNVVSHRFYNVEQINTEDGLAKLLFLVLPKVWNKDLVANTPYYLSFDLIDDYVDTPAISTPSAFHVTLVVEGKIWGNIVEQANSFIISYDGKILKLSVYSGGTLTDIVSGNVTLHDGKPHIVTVGFNSGNEGVIYIDGKEVARTATTATIDVTTNPITIANVEKLYYALMESKYPTNYDAERMFLDVYTPTDRVFEYNVDEGSGTVLNDVGGVNNGTITGAVWGKYRVNELIDYDIKITEVEDYPSNVTVWDTNSTTAPTETDLANKSTGGVVWSKITNPEHDFGDNWIVVENGLVALTIKNGVGNLNQGKLYIFTPEGWKLYGRIRHYHWISGSADQSILSDTNNLVTIIHISSDKVVIKWECYGLEGGAYSSNVIVFYRGKQPIVLFDKFIGTELHPNYQQHYDTIGNYTRWFTYFEDTLGNVRLYDSLFATSGDVFSAIPKDSYYMRIRDDNIINVIGVQKKQNIGVWPHGIINVLINTYEGNYILYGVKYFSFNSLFKEAENGYLSGNAVIDTTLTDDSGDSVRLDNQNDQVSWAQSGVNYAILPAGTYRVFFRVKDLNQVVNDVRLMIHKTDKNFVYQGAETKTITATANFDYYYMDITVDGDTVYGIAPAVAKATTTTNSIWVDYFLIVPISNGKDFPEDIAHDALTLVEPIKIVPTDVEGNIYANRLTIPTSPPDRPKDGDMYFDVSTGTLYIYDGTTWKSVSLV